MDVQFAGNQHVGQQRIDQSGGYYDGNVTVQPQLIGGQFMQPQIGGQQFDNMGSLAKDITETLDDQPNQPPQLQPTINPQLLNQYLLNAQKKSLDTNKTKVFEKIPILFREPLIIVIVYVILSLDIVKQTLGSYIPQIKPGANGVHIVGYVIYGLIMAIAIMTLKKLLL